MRIQNLNSIIKVYRKALSNKILTTLTKNKVNTLNRKMMNVRTDLGQMISLDLMDPIMDSCGWKGDEPNEFLIATRRNPYIT